MDLPSQTSVVDAFAKAGRPEEAEQWLEGAIFESLFESWLLVSNSNFFKDQLFF